MNSEYSKDNPAPNSCVNCKYEMTCGYSYLVTLGKRTKFSYDECCLGKRSYNNGTFFEKKSTEGNGGEKMRLIDADELEKEMNELCCGECECCALEKCPAHNQPTAYDVDKVVERLESRKTYLLKEFVLADKDKSVKKTALDRIDEIDGNIEIVKAGGANENR